MKKEILFFAAFIAVNSFNFMYAQTGNVGIGTSTPTNSLTVNGNTSVGSGYTGITAPTNGAIIEGNTGIGTSAPAAKLDVLGQTKLSDGTIAPSAPASGSIVELESNNKGLRMPQIALINTSSWSPLLGSGTNASSHGMSVYNTNTGITSSNTSYPSSGVGEYYWDGIGWVNKSNTGAQNAEVLFSVKRTAFQTATNNVNVVCDFTAKDYDKNNNFDLTSNTFTVPAKGAGFYQINGYSVTNADTAAQGGYLTVFVNNILVRNITVGNSAAGAGIASSGTIAIPLQVGDAVNIRYRANTVGQTFIPQVDVYQLSK